MSLLGEIKRRNVFQVALVYAVVAWLLIEVAATVEDPLGLPGWVDTFVIVLVVVGLPLALILSWIFDMTPRGIVRTSESSATNEIGSGANESTVQAHGQPKRGILPNSVAVLPFENLSPNPDDAYFSAGIHEEILSHLAKILEINVIARTSVMQYAGVARPIAEIASELNVGTVMEGSVRYAGDRVRVTAQLIEGKTGTHLWTETYDRDLADIFVIQTDIATQITTALEAKLSPRERETITEQPTTSTEAYALYLRAIAQYGDAGNLPDPTGLPSLRASIQSYLDRAIELDGEFALAHAWKAQLYISSRQNDPVKVGDWHNRKAELERLVTQHAERAVAIDSNLGHAHTLLATLHFYNWHAAEARIGFERSLQLSPNDPQVLLWCTVFEYARDQYEDAAKLAERGTSLDPNNPLAYGVLGYSLWKAGHLEASAKIFEKGISVNPGVPLCHIFLSGLEIARGNHEDALRALKVADQLMPIETAPGIRAHVAWSYGRLGQRAEVERLFNEIQESATRRYVDSAVWALLYMGLGDHDRALKLYKDATRDISVIQDPWILHYSRQNICSDPVIDEPRFQEVLSGLWITE